MDPKTDADIISNEIKLEGGVGSTSNDPADAGGLTFEGLSSKANPDLFVNGLPTDSQVRQRYQDMYITSPGFDGIVDAKVRSLLVDWGVNSGPGIAIKGLQEALGTTIDGVLGPNTLAAANAAPGGQLVGQLVAERVRMIGRIVQKSPSQLKFLGGWLDRAVQWIS